MTLALWAVMVLAARRGQPATENSVGEEDSASRRGAGDAGGQRYPDVVDAELEPTGDTWSLDVTISSPYDSPERYADGWRVLSPDGPVLGEHRLAHDHAGEQPFTRTQTGLKIPEGVDEITVEGRDRERLRRRDRHGRCDPGLTGPRRWVQAPRAFESRIVKEYPTGAMDERTRIRLTKYSTKAG